MPQPPVVLLHGMWSRGSTLDALRQALTARGYPVLAPTLPLHPVQSPAELEALGRLSLRDYAAALSATIQAAKLPTAPVLIGHSMGGLLAQMLAARMPVRAAVLLAPAPPAGIHLVRPRNLWHMRKVLTTPAFWRKPQMPSADLAQAALFAKVPPGRSAELRAALLPESGRAYAEIVFWWADRARAARVDAGRVQCPVLVVAGGDDAIIPLAVARRVCARYPAAEMLVLPGRGHWFFEEPGADQVFARVLSWLDLVCAVTDATGAPRAAEPRAPAPASA